MTNEIIAAHEDWQEALVKEFEEQISNHVDEVDRELRSNLSRSLEFDDVGDLISSPENAQIVRNLDRIFRESVKMSGYDAAIGAFVGHFSDEVHNFFSMYREMQRTVPELPEISVSDANADDLGNRASAALRALDSVVTDTSSALRKYSPAWMGEVQKFRLLDHVSDTIGKSKSVGFLGKNLLTSFFRRATNLGYKSVEKSLSLKFTYAGTGGTRDFCRDMLSREPLSRWEIAQLDNGQVPGVMENGGGANCAHFWWIASAEPVAEGAP